MNISRRTGLLWMPRLLGIGECLFLSVFALDVFEPGVPLPQALLAFVIHVAPMMIFLLLVGLSWRWEWIGALAFTGGAAVYTAMAWRHPLWVVLIAGPLFLVGGLFWYSWRHHVELRQTGHSV